MLLPFLLVVAALQAAQTPRDTFFSSTLSPADLQDKQAVIETTHGTIVLDLLADAAPNHVAFFITNARAGAFDGTTFHRIITRGLIQGGDPLSKDPAQAARYGTGGLRRLRFEPNGETHTRGAVSAVLIPGDRDSAGSQFFIVISDQPQLDGEFTVFARVAEGIGVAEAISLAPATASVPDERIAIARVTIRDRQAPPPEPFSTETVEELSRMRVTFETAFGTLTAELFPDRAPGHVRQFLRLAASGTYDGTAFHRVARGFVIQGGYLPTRRTPLTPEQQGLVRMLPPEFNDTPHELGTLSMARGDDPGSADTSFFIVLARTPSLDRQYTVFGRITEGLDVVEKIAAVAVDGETPVERVEVARVRIDYLGQGSKVNGQR